MSNLRKAFKDPGVEYRSAPFWSWNDKLELEELKWQIREMKKQGLGGFFMHSREGLETEYLGSEWMKCVRGSVEEAKQLGMLAFLYDEDRWPSGFAGGLVPRLGGDECKAKALVLEVKPGGLYQPDSEVQRVFLAKLSGRTLLKLKNVTKDKKIHPGKNEVILIFRLKISGGSEWHNDGPYGDNLSPVSVRKFIETTYEAYKKEVGSEFSKTIPAIFTDEPHVDGYRGQAGERSIPWTTVFADFFQQRRGYDILDRIPHFFFESQESFKICHDYWKTITELFASSFSKQLGDWCEQNNIELTGHYLCEDNFFDQIRNGGAVMPQYQYQHAPGIDILTESISETLTVKQCSSVAHQFNRPRVLSELYGCSGWNFTFEGQKWVGDWQYVLGVNFRCQHLTLYTLRGCRKRDYPPSINYQNTWWPYYRTVEDYFARLSFVLSQGQPVREILLLHPIASAWGKHNFVNHQDVHDLSKQFEGLSEGLMAIHRDHDYGDELIMEKYGRVRGKAFVVNQASYKMVVVPSCLTLSSSTVKLLQSFLKAGGQVMALKPLPRLVDARPSSQLNKLFKHRNMTLLDDTAQLKVALDKALPSRLMVQNELHQEIGPIIHMEREVGNKRFLFLVNTDRTNSYQAQISLKGQGSVEAWDTLTGKTKPISCLSQAGYLRFKAQFGPADSHLYMIDPKGKPKIIPERPLVSSGGAHLGPVWQYERTHPNALPLDFCEYSLNGRAFSERLPVWQAQHQVRSQLGLRSIAYNGITQRWKWLRYKKQLDKAEAVFRFRFRVKDEPQTPVCLVLEGAQYFSIELNGIEVVNQPDGWYIDKAFARIKLPEIKVGENVLTLTCSYKDEMEVEDCYLIGDFGVDANSLEIVTEPDVLHSGDWCLQRYPFYAGTMMYKQTTNLTQLQPGERVFLRLSAYQASVIKVKVNGQEAGFIPWRTVDKIEMTPFIRAGDNLFEIEVVGSPRNLLGPLHYKPGKPGWTGCGEFRTENEQFTPDYILVPYGIMGQVTLGRFMSPAD